MTQGGPLREFEDKHGPADAEPFDSPIRIIRGHAVYRRPERCRVCGCPTDLFITGLSGETTWSWLWPHSRCSMREFIERVVMMTMQHDPTADRAFDLGPVKVSAMFGQPGWSILPNLRAAIDRHAAGDFGSFGQLDPTLEVDPLTRWCPGAFEVAIRNALSIQNLDGPVCSRRMVPLVDAGQPSRIEVLILTTLDPLDPSTAVLPVVEAPGFSIGAELQRHDVTQAQSLEVKGRAATSRKGTDSVRTLGETQGQGNEPNMIDSRDDMARGSELRHHGPVQSSIRPTPAIDVRFASIPPGRLT